MEIRVKKTLAESIGFAKFKAWGLDKDEWRWGDAKTIKLADLPAADIEALAQLFEAHKAKRGAGVLLRDVRVWQETLKSGAADRKPRSVRQFYDLARAYLAKVPKHWVYRQDANDQTWVPYHVNELEYHPEQTGERHHPAFTNIELVYKRFGGLYETYVNFYDQDVRGFTIVQALAEKGLFAETTDMFEPYTASMRRWFDLQPRVGTQCLAEGLGWLDGMDGNKASRDSSWWWKTQDNVQLTRQGDSARVVVDVFWENGEPDRRREPHVNEYYWRCVAVDPGESEDEDDDEALAELDAEEAVEKGEDPGDKVPLRAKIPIHPLLAVFDLRKHQRVRVHVDQLTEYVYDRALADKLVLSAERKALIKLLIDSKANAFTDIVKGKSGGSIVLLAGPPGTGKTLTAEVYAESEQCALYSVQCSQLGIDPAALEDELLKVFTRAGRWNAVLLLDEADVYVHERGNDLTQNAIVGVFLRVLEYQSSVMFLTTNRPDDVDDAIASRCVARLDYETPNREELAQIWRVLAVSSGCTIADDELDTIVNCFAEISGRDVKNLLKLARLKSTTITYEMVDFVSEFKPTGKRHD